METKHRRKSGKPESSGHSEQSEPAIASNAQPEGVPRAERLTSEEEVGASPNDWALKNRVEEQAHELLARQSGPRQEALEVLQRATRSRKGAAAKQWNEPLITQAEKTLKEQPGLLRNLRDFGRADWLARKGKTERLKSFLKQRARKAAADGVKFYLRFFRQTTDERIARYRHLYGQLIGPAKAARAWLKQERAAAARESQRVNREELWKKYEAVCQAQQELNPVLREFDAIPKELFLDLALSRDHRGRRTPSLSLSVAVRKYACRLAGVSESLVSRKSLRKE